MTDILFNVIDLETDGEDPPAAVLEIGRTMVLLRDGEVLIADEATADFFGCDTPLNPEARAVHHISPAEIAGRPLCDADALRAASTSDHNHPGAIMVAHNCAFEQKWFSAAVIGPAPWICTYKAALRVWPDAPRHTNSVLRYWLEGQGLVPDLSDRVVFAHRAAPDSYVTAHVLKALLDHATVAQLVEWTLEPKLFPKITFGKHKGAAWSEPPYDYLTWLAFKSDMDEDTKWNARRELDRRQARGR